MDKTRITNANKQHARRSAGAGEIKEIIHMKITMIEIEATADEIKASQNIGQNIMSILNRAFASAADYDGDDEEDTDGGEF